MTWIAYCNVERNTIKLSNFETNEEYGEFQGVDLPFRNGTRTLNISRLSNVNCYKDSWTHVREISGSKYLISFHHSIGTSANFEIFDLAHPRNIKKLYTFEEVRGGIHYRSL